MCVQIYIILASYQGWAPHAKLLFLICNNKPQTTPDL